jgi:hypothetical protein
MDFRVAWRESLAIYLLLLADYGRIIRFAGAPALVLCVLGVAQMTGMEGGGGSLLLLLSLLGTIWSVGVWTTRWTRFLLLGEDQVQFWDMPIDRRVWRTGGIVLALILGSLLAAIIPASMVMAVITGLVGGLPTDAPPVDAPALAAMMPDWLHLLAVLICLLMMLWPVARLAPGIGAVVQDQPMALGASWKATARLGGLPVCAAMLLVSVPLQIPSFLLVLAALSSGNVLLLLITNLVMSITQPLVAAASALLWARIYGVAIGPYIKPRPVRTEDEAE